MLYLYHIVPSHSEICRNALRIIRMRYLLPSIENHINAATSYNIIGLRAILPFLPLQLMTNANTNSAHHSEFMYLYAHLSFYGWLHQPKVPQRCTIYAHNILIRQSDCIRVILGEAWVFQNLTELIQ